MDRRLELHQLLKEITENVYFQPPTNIQLDYPCIIYQRDNLDTKFADDSPYALKTRYAVTIIDRDPDSLIPGEVAKMPLSSFNRFYTADNLNHDVYSVYF